MANFKSRASFKLNRALALVGGFNAETLAGTKTLTAKDSTFQALDCGGGARNVVLPAGEVKGRYFIIANKSDASENITLQQPDASSTAATINQNDMAIVYAADDIADAASSGWSLFFMVSGSIT